MELKKHRRFYELLRECENSSDRLGEILDFRRSEGHSICKIILKNHLDDEGIDGIIVKFRDITKDRLKNKYLQEKMKSLELSTKIVLMESSWRKLMVLIRLPILPCV
ncbi:hypothetical protein [uncultured Christiangramia sp.]|uniref:hypothetical protein n=1 Tax=uncultured Christiangramia sp. TaxID=503836 RepID=UPI002635E282|nr:hypothetical protein [uncultured Christiangramia sp.]